MAIVRSFALFAFGFVGMRFLQGMGIHFIPAFLILAAVCVGVVVLFGKDHVDGGGL